MATLLVPALAAATEISTDLWIYQYGDTVTVTGIDFGADEDVSVVTTDPFGAGVDSGVAHTDASGGFTYSFTLLSDVPGIYDVVARGLTSGLTAATQFDPINIPTTTTLSVSASSVTYGGTVTLSGTLAWTAGTYNNGQQTKDGRTITFRSYGNNTCTSSPATLGSATTSGGGASGTASYSFNYMPAATGTRYLRAEFATFSTGSGGSQDNYQSSNSACVQLNVTKANTTASGSTSVSSLFVGQSFNVSYLISAASGVGGQTATGSISIEKVGVTPSGSLGCLPATVSLSQAQTAGGFSQSGTNTFTCTPAGAGTWNLQVLFNATPSGNYNDSSSTTLTVVVNALHNTTLTETLTPSTITYGESTVVTGSLDDTTAGVPIVNVAVENDRQTGGSCGGSSTLIGSDLTDGNGDYSVTYRPTQTESKDIKAFYAGDAGHLPAEACATLTVERAPTEIVDAALSNTAITLLESAFVDYKLQSAYGVLGNNANGTLSIVQDSGAGTLTCTATTTAVNRPEANADGTGADDAGFGLVVDVSTNTAYRFECTASADDTYTLHVHFTGDADFDPSDSETLTLVVASNTPPTVDAGGPYIGTEGSAIALDGASANDPDGDLLTYLWTIDDSTIDAGGDCTIANDTSLTLATVTCTDDSNGGTFTATLTVSGDPDGPVADSADVTVNNATPTVSLSSGNSLSVTESTTAVEYGYTGDDAGDNDTLSKTINCGAHGSYVAASDDGDSFQCVFIDGGGPVTPATSSDVTITVTDDDGAASTQAKQTVAIANANPVVAQPSFSATTICQGSQATLTGISFSDAGTVDMPWGISIDWGDGSADYAGSTNTPGGQENVSPTYNTPGTYTATVTVTDKDGGSGSNTSTNQVTVVAHYSITFLQPVDGTTTGAATNGVKLGRVVPVKILIRDNCANNFAGGWVTDPAAIVRLRASLSTNVDYTLLDSVEQYADAGAANGNTLLFRWTADASAPSGGFWIYNLDTKNSNQPKFELSKTYRIDATIGGFLATGATSQYALLVMQK